MLLVASMTMSRKSEPDIADKASRAGLEVHWTCRVVAMSAWSPNDRDVQLHPVECREPGALQGIDVALPGPREAVPGSAVVLLVYRDDETSEEHRCLDASSDPTNFSVGHEDVLG